MTSSSNAGTSQINSASYLISFKEKYEFDYAAKQLQKQVPGATRKDAKEALTEAAKKVNPSEGREKIMRAARKNLRD